VAVQVAQSGNNSGTLQSGEGVDHPHPQWHQPATDSHRHAHGQETGEDQVSEAALQEYFSRQWEQHGGPSNRRGGAEPRTMDPSSGLGYGLDPGPSAHQPDPDGQHNLAFRAMLGQEALVPPPRGRRRSHSLSLRRLPDSMSFQPFLRSVLIVSPDRSRTIDRSINIISYFPTPRSPSPPHIITSYTFHPPI
jgi:hypothetical protein